MCSAVLIGSLVSGTSFVAEASTNDFNTKVAQQVVGQFKDVNKSNYAYDAINWAKSEGIIDGYQDGTFKPSGTITEAQFAKMLAEFLKLKDDKGDLIKATPAAHWSDTYYDALATYGVPMNGYFDNGLRNKPVKRGVIAQAIGHVTGSSNTLTASIDYMLGEGITSGQNPQYAGKDLLKYFGSQNNLTRGQVAAFLYRMHNADIDEASGISIAVRNNSEGLTLVGQANKGMNKLDNSLRIGKLGSEKPGNGGGITVKPPVNPPVVTPPAGDFSGAKLPVSDSAKAKDVNVNELNKVVSHLSSGTIDQFKKNGYEIKHASPGMIFTNDFAITVTSSSDINTKYIFSYDKGVPLSFIKSVVKDLSGITLTDADLSSKGEVIKGKVYIMYDSNGGRTINIRR